MTIFARVLVLITLFVISGNAAEWTNDVATGASLPNPSIDPGGDLRLGTSRILRGGTFYAWSSLLRSASRALGTSPGLHLPGFGLRLVQTRPPS